jgi:DeoR/GlpR family transcriptional regulator of sugar metabolism
VLADSTKWGGVGVSTFARLDEADVLVTDMGLTVPAQMVIGEHVGELVLAPSVVSGDHTS